MEIRQISYFEKLIDRTMATACILIVSISIILVHGAGLQFREHPMVLSNLVAGTLLFVAAYLAYSTRGLHPKFTESLRIIAVIFCVVLAVVGLRSYIFPVHFWMNIIRPIGGDGWQSFFTQVAPNTALCYLALALYLVSHNRPLGKMWLIPTLALVVMFGLGMTSIFGYVSGITFAYHWLDGPQMLLASALVFSSIGVLGSLRAFVQEYYSASLKSWRVPIMVGLLVGYANIGIFRALLADSQVKIETLEREFTVPVDIHADSYLPETVFALGWVLTLLGLIMSRMVLVLTARRQSLQAEIEKRERYERELHLAKKQADDASRFKSEFLANMSHEIRSPLQAIIGYAELLRTTLISVDERDRALRSIERNGSLLSRLIDRVLDLSKIEAGKMSFEKAQIDLLDVLQDLYSLFARRAALKGLQFKFEQRGPLPRYFESDPTRFRQILMNLISNAIKFTIRGEVKVILASAPWENGGQKLKVWIKDSGIGIPEGQQESIFDEFTQADASISREFGGTGLGLALSRKIARALGGDIFCEKSQLGQGSCFVLSLPLLETAVEWAENLVKPDLFEQQLGNEEFAKLSDEFISGKQILLVDDAWDSRLILCRFLEASGAKIATAKSGAEGLSWLVNREFDLICLDIELPDINGYDLAARVRSNGYRGPLLALTAHAMQEVKQRCLDAGFDDLLSKPVTREGLLQKIASLPGMEITPPSPACSVFVNDALIAPLLPLFLKSLPDRLEKLRQARAKSNWSDFFAMTHQIRGTASSYGFQVIGEAAAELDALKSPDPDLSSVDDGVLRLMDSYQQACAAHKFKPDEQGSAEKTISGEKNV